MHLMKGRSIAVGASITVEFALRFGAGWQQTGQVDSGAVAIVNDVLSDFGKRHPFKNVNLGGGTMGYVLPNLRMICTRMITY